MRSGRGTRHVLIRRAIPVPLILLLVGLTAAALAVPPEPLHLAGIQDGGDFDSVIQPLVLGLAGVPQGCEVPALVPRGPRPGRAWFPPPAALPAPAARSAPSRAPPA